MVTLIEIPIYNRNIVVGSDCTCAEYKEWIKTTLECGNRIDTILDTVNELFADGRRYKASTVNIQNAELLLHFRDKSPGVIAHEAFHITYAILDDAGIKLSFKSDETFAYLIEYLVTEITEVLKIKKAT